jgi:hypothetical protein
MADEVDGRTPINDLAAAELCRLPRNTRKFFLPKSSPPSVIDDGSAFVNAELRSLSVHHSFGLPLGLFYNALVEQITLLKVKISKKGEWSYPIAMEQRQRRLGIFLEQRWRHSILHFVHRKLCSKVAIHDTDDSRTRQ